MAVMIPTLGKALAAVVPILFIRLFYVVRRNRINHQELPQPERSMLWGHLALIGEALASLSPHAQIDTAFEKMAKKVGRPPVMFVDLWPINLPFAVVTTHHVAEQVSRATKQFPYSLPKSPVMQYLEPLTGPDSMVVVSGHRWKQLRRRYNPGFAPSHIQTLLPAVIDSIEPFIEHLDRIALEGEEVVMGDYTTNVTFDIIGKVTMDMDLRAQMPRREQRHPVLNMYLDILQTYAAVEDSPVAAGLLHPINHLNRLWLAYKIRPLLRKVIHDKHAEMMREKKKKEVVVDEKSGGDEAKKRTRRSVLALSLEGEGETLPSSLVESTVDNLKTFLFAGHDTTSIVVQWCLYELERSPRAAAAVRRELDDVLGPDQADPRAVMDAFRRKGDEILRRMTYTSAFIKEVHRLYPAGGSARYARPGDGVTVTDAEGRAYRLDGCIVYNCATLIQTDEAVFGPTAGEFVPERWIGNTDMGMRTNEGDSSSSFCGSGENKTKVAADDDVAASSNNYGGVSATGTNIPAAAWRPFERGPRNCIGQELANMEVKVILACVARRYEFVKVGVGAMKRDEDGNRILREDGHYETDGEPLYSSRAVTARPVDHLRAKVKIRGADG